MSMSEIQQAIQDADAKFSKMAMELESLRQENSRLREALRLLYDNQSGPPLYKSTKKWTEAMRLASDLLNPPKP